MFSSILNKIVLSERGANNQLNGARTKGSLTSARGQIPSGIANSAISRPRSSRPPSLKDSESKPPKAVSIATKCHSPTTVASFPMTNSNDKSEATEEAQKQNLDFTATGDKVSQESHSTSQDDNNESQAVPQSPQVKEYSRINLMVEQYYILSTTEEDQDFEVTNRNVSKETVEVDSDGDGIGKLADHPTPQEQRQKEVESQVSWPKDRMRLSRTSIRLMPREEQKSVSLTLAALDSDDDNNGKQQQHKVTNSYDDVKITSDSIVFK